MQNAHHAWDNESMADGPCAPPTTRKGLLQPLPMKVRLTQVLVIRFLGVD